jgi:hypothetical protein
MCYTAAQGGAEKMPWRERFREFLEKERDSLERRLGYCESHSCEMWETIDGQRKDVTEEYAAGLRSRLAEIEQMLIEEELS